MDSQSTTNTPTAGKGQPAAGWSEAESMTQLKSCRGPSQLPNSGLNHDGYAVEAECLCDVTSVLGGGATVLDPKADETRSAVRWIAWGGVHPGNNHELSSRLRITQRRQRTTASRTEGDQALGCTDTSTVGVCEGCRAVPCQLKCGHRCARISVKKRMNATLPNDRGFGNGSITIRADTR